MTPFHVGMKVVCVDDVAHGKYNQSHNAVGDLDGLTRGVVYTVRYHGLCEYDGCLLVLKLNEIVRPPLGCAQHDIGYAAARFRPAHENRMDELRTLLAPSPSKANTPEPVQS